MEGIQIPFLEDLLNGSPFSEFSDWTDTDMLHCASTLQVRATCPDSRGSGYKALDAGKQRGAMNSKHAIVPL
eukprot:896107-Amphidinium_carterae.1